MKQFLLLATLSLSMAAQSMPFKLQAGYLIVATCSIGDLHNLVALVDTGVTETTLDLKIVRRLGLTTQKDTATIGTREAAVESVSIPEIEFGPLRAQNLGAIATDLLPLTYLLGIRPDVLIGTDLLRRSRFLIDYRAKIIIFGELPALKHSVPLFSDSGLALVDAVADGKTLRLQVDTGFNVVLIYGNKSSFLTRTDLDARGSDFAHSLHARASIAHNLRLGDWSGRQVTVYATDDEPRGVAFDGLLGPKAIGVHRLGFDFEQQRIGWD